MKGPGRRPPLEGVLVLDLSRVLAGPLATMLLADLGARVVKVEDPRGGDPTRSWAPPSFDGEAAYFLSVNRRKESIALDLSRAEDAEIVRKLALLADVVVENFLPGTLEGFGLSLDALRAANPRLVTCTISGYGVSGPSAGLPGFDLLAQGASGLMSITGPTDAPPSKAGVAVVDVLAGWAAVTAILAALRARDRDGTGSHVATDLFSSAVFGLVNVAGNALVSGTDAPRLGNAHPSIEPYRPFRARDGFFLVACGTDAQFGALARVVSLPDLASDERFLTNPCRVANREALVELLSERFAMEDAGTWIARCRAAGVPAGEVATVLEALRSEEARANGLVLETYTPGRALVPTVRAPFLLEGFDPPRASAPPRLDEGREAVVSMLVRGSAAS